MYKDFTVTQFLDACPICEEVRNFISLVDMPYLVRCDYCNGVFFSKFLTQNKED